MSAALAQASGIFAAPGLATAGAAAVAVPVAIHLLTRWRRRPQPWAAMRFLLAAYERHKRRLRVEQWLLLLLRCLAVLLLGLALADPALGGWADVLGFRSGRVVWLVVDDGMSMRAASGDRTRWKRWRERAWHAVTPLGPGERVGIVRATRAGSKGPWLAPTGDASRAREALERIEPGYGQADLGAALERVDDRLEARGGSTRRDRVVVVSDFARGPKGLALGSRPELATMGSAATVSLTPPAAPTANRQIAALAPRRRLWIVRKGERRTAGLTATLRRFGGAAKPDRASVRFALLGPDGEPVASAERRARWLEGQRGTRVSVTLEWAASAEPGWLADRRVHDVAVRASLEDDALPADDRAWAVARLRRPLRVAVLGRRGGSGAPTPAEWLRLAMAPGETGSGLDPRLVAPDTAEAGWRGADAVWITRPDRLPADAWPALRKSAERGGLVAVMPPTGGGTGWVARAADALGLEVEGASIAEAGGKAGWGLHLKGAVPKPLNVLATDWRKLLKPVRVHRRLAWAPAGGSPWLALADGRPLLTVSAVGAGHVMAWTTSPAPRWSNLATKPLFVPLVHEGVKGLLERSAPAARLADARVGKRPALGPAWGDVAALDAPGDRRLEIGSAAAGGRRRPAKPLPAPGVYRGAKGGPAFAAHVDPALGDLGARSRSAVAAWFDPIRVHWLDEKRRHASGPSRSRLGWSLLWVLMALVLAETLLGALFGGVFRLRGRRA